MLLFQMSRIVLVVMFATIYAYSTDCPNLVNLARGLGVQSVNPTLWTELQGDCCSATGVVCFNQLVISISWSNMGLRGTINGTAIPSGLTFIDLYRNKLSGRLPLSFPAGLTDLYVHYNNLNGSIPVLPNPLNYLYLHFNLLSGVIPTIPNGLKELFVEGNALYGDLPIFPNTLQYFYLGFPGQPGNHFSGTLRLNRPIHLYINDNWITDIIIQDGSQINPSFCDLSNNPLLGNPNIAGLTMCTKIGLYSASLLPVTRSTIPLETTITASASTSTADTASIDQVSMTTTISAATIVHFEQHEVVFVINFRVLFRVLIDGMIFAVVLSRTPFVRELKKLFNKQIDKEKSNTGFSIGM